MGQSYSVFNQNPSLRVSIGDKFSINGIIFMSMGAREGMSGDGTGSGNTGNRGVVKDGRLK